MSRNIFSMTSLVPTHSGDPEDCFLLFLHLLVQVPLRFLNNCRSLQPCSSIAFLLQYAACASFFFSLKSNDLIGATLCPCGNKLNKIAASARVREELDPALPELALRVSIFLFVPCVLEAASPRDFCSAPETCATVRASVKREPPQPHTGRNFVSPLTFQSALVTN